MLILWEHWLKLRHMSTHKTRYTVYQSCISRTPSDIAHHHTGVPIAVLGEMTVFLSTGWLYCSSSGSWRRQSWCGETTDCVSGSGQHTDWGTCIYIHYVVFNCWSTVSLSHMGGDVSRRLGTYTDKFNVIMYIKFHTFTKLTIPAYLRHCFLQSQCFSLILVTSYSLDINVMYLQDGWTPLYIASNNISVTCR